MASTTPTSVPDVIREELLGRRERLAAAVEQVPNGGRFRALLEEVDAALERLSTGAYGICETCDEAIEPERLAVDPLLRFCLGHLTPEEQRRLEEDLNLASLIQSNLLPQRRLRHEPWEVCYHYEPAGPVGGDYCDLVGTDSGELFFVVGDASGKGVAASMVAAQLHAMFRTLVALTVPLDQLLERANRIFCESMLAGHFATLVCGHASPSGAIELANAGHLPSLVLSRGRGEPLEATGLPLGLFRTSTYEVRTLKLEPGETLLLYTDGASEARSATSAVYGTSRLQKLAVERQHLPPEQLVRACLEDLAAFRAGAPRADDLTVMAVRRL